MLIVYLSYIFKFTLKFVRCETYILLFLCAQLAQLFLL